eukprot:gene26003-31400_t
MSYPMLESARKNFILAALPLIQYARISEHLKSVDLLTGQVIYEPGESLDFVYFPTTCTTSLVLQTQDGETSELAMTGRDGLVGIPLVLGGASMNHRVMVQRAGRAFRMSADVFEAELLHSKALQQLALSYVQAMITQMSQSILCIGHHAVSERLCYWLLFNGDALPEEPIKITHEMIAHMLGVRRESVTQALGKLQTAGLVSSGRGKIAILDREGLTQQPDDALSAPDARLLQKYQDAYDFAPVGFVNLDAQCQVVHTNLAGAIMLGVQRSSRSKHSFLSFISAEDHERFLAFHQSVLSGKCRDHLEVTLSGTGRRADMIVRIDGTLDDLGEECALVLIDVTREKKRMTELLEHERQQHQVYSGKPSDMAWFNDKEGRVLPASSNLIDQFRPMTGQGTLADLDADSAPQQVPHGGFFPGLPWVQDENHRADKNAHPLGQL